MALKPLDIVDDRKPSPQAAEAKEWIAYMGRDWAKLTYDGGEKHMNWSSLARKLPGFIIQAVDLAEQISGARTGGAKQEAVIRAVKDSVAIIESAADKDLLNDPEVEALARDLIDILVRLRNVVTKKQEPK